MTHHFDINLAQRLDVNKAIVLQNFIFWLQYNKEHQVNIFEGRVWTYCSVSALAKIMPYFSDRSIDYNINELCKQGFLLKNNFSKDKRNRTTWYALSDKFFNEFPEYSILQICEMHFTKNDILDFTNSVNPFHEIVKCNKDINIEDKNKDLNNNICVQKTFFAQSTEKNANESNNETTEAEPLSRISKIENDLKIKFNEFWSMYPKKYDKKRAETAFVNLLKRKSIKDREALLNDIFQGLNKYNSYLKQNKTEPDYIKSAVNWIKGECWINDYSLNKGGQSYGADGKMNGGSFDWYRGDLKDLMLIKEGKMTKEEHIKNNPHLYCPQELTEEEKRIRAEKIAKFEARDREMRKGLDRLREIEAQQKKNKG